MRKILVLFASILFSIPAWAVMGDVSIISWNLKQMGPKAMNFKGVAAQLMGADIITFQEMNADEKGKAALNKIAKNLADITSEKICKGWSEIPSGSKERYAYLWKNRIIAYAKANGELVNDCPDKALIIPLGSKNAAKIFREPAYGIFYVRDVKQKFVLASVHLQSEEKKPAKEVGPLFDTFKDETLPVIVAGDFNLESGKDVFRAATDLSFEPALMGVKTTILKNKRKFGRAFDNFWFRNATFVFGRVVSLFDAFPDMKSEEIHRTLSENSPIIARFNFAPTKVGNPNGTQPSSPAVAQ